MGELPTAGDLIALPQCYQPVLLSEGDKVSFVEKLQKAAADVVQPPHPWRLRLERVRGKLGFDGLERISTQTLMDVLEVAQRDRTAGTYRHLATLMAELGWAPVRVRDFTRGGYKEQVRGYVRTPPCRTERTSSGTATS